MAINAAIFEKGYTYEQYQELVSRLTQEGKTSGTDQSEALIEYTKLNEQRMHRAAKTFKLQDETVAALRRIERPQYWVVLAEAWCGDAALNLPHIAAMAASNPNIQLRILLRDEHLPLMDQYLTNGGRAIPKLIAFDAETMDEQFQWGPRPAAAQQIVLDWKAAGGTDTNEKAVKVQKWYAKDRGKTIQEEFTVISNP